jgi:hypothetical protein
MTKFTTIKAGYRLTVTTWENDGDNYNTEIKEGLEKAEVYFLTDILKLFDRSSWNGPSDFGNMYEPSDDEIYRLAVAIRSVAVKHEEWVKANAEWLLDEIPEDEDGRPEYMDGAYDFLYDLGIGSGEFYTRVCESFKVEYTPNDIQLQDVTAEFK